MTGNDPRTVLSHIERGSKWPYPDTIVNIAIALEIEIFELFRAEQNANTIDPAKIDSLITKITISVERP